MEINVRPHKWRKKWWRYNLIPHLSAMDVGNDETHHIERRWFQFVWMALTIDVLVRVKRAPKEFKNAWSWPKWSD